MTFTEIVSEIAGRLNLSSTVALARIGTNVNIRNRQVTTALGLDTSGRASVAALATIGSTNITFANSLKIFSVSKTTLVPPFPLSEVTVDDLKNRIRLSSDMPREYAIYRVGATSVTIQVDAIPLTAYSLTAEVLEKTATLSGSTAPPFDENYHDILVYGVMATELFKLEKFTPSKEMEGMFRQRLDEYKYFVQKSAYLMRWAGKNRSSRRTTYLVTGS